MFCFLCGSAGRGREREDVRERTDCEREDVEERRGERVEGQVRRRHPGNCFSYLTPVLRCALVYSVPQHYFPSKQSERKTGLCTHPCI